MTVVDNSFAAESESGFERSRFEPPGVAGPFAVLKWSNG